MEKPVSDAQARCFLGLALPLAARKSLENFGAEWARAGLGGAWVPCGNFHVTLRFLGSVPEAQRARLDIPLARAFGQCPALQVRLAGTGAFPSVRRPRVLWAGLDVLAGDMEKLIRAAEAGTAALGLPEEKRAHQPHVTLVRLRRPPPEDLTSRFLAETRAFVSDAFPVLSVALWKSALRPDGPVYEQLREYPLS